MNTMQKVSLETSWVYGPINSRRFGNDLGINLLPLKKKYCTFDCLYCQYGFTELHKTAADDFPSAEQIISCLQQFRTKGPIEHITVAGNGEPTMHPRFAEIARAIFDWRDQFSNETILALFTNGYRLTSPEIRSVIQNFDEPIVKLDSANMKTIMKLNKPAPGFDLSKLIQQLKDCKKIIIQTMFVKGWNDSMRQFESWVKALSFIRPVRVQIYTISRAPALSELQPVSSEWLYETSLLASNLLQLPVRAYTDPT